MKIQLDTDVVLDLLLDRIPFSEDAAALFSLAENGKIEAYVAATTITTVHYLAGRATNVRKARRMTTLLMSLVEIAPVNQTVLSRALTNGFTDYEDAVIHESARLVGADVVITRNLKDYKRATLSVMSPKAFLKAFWGGTFGDVGRKES